MPMVSLVNNDGARCVPVNEALLIPSGQMTVKLAAAAFEHEFCAFAFTLETQIQREVAVVDVEVEVTVGAGTVPHNKAVDAPRLLRHLKVRRSHLRDGPINEGQNRF